MSEVKISPNLFLEQAELNRLKKFLDTDGIKANLIANSDAFGLIKKENSNSSLPFINALVEEDTSLTIKIREIKALNNKAQLIYSPALSQITIPSTNLWYWVKIAYQTSTEESGVFTVDNSGNLVCTSNDAELLTILRGQPNYPSRVKFTNATNNILEYDVLEVVDNQNAVLQGSFTTESNLKVAVVGTFTPGYVALTSEKFIFQYDSCLITLVQSNSNVEPVHLAGLEFFIARVKNNGSTLFIEDKRSEIWTTDSNFFLKKMDRFGNPLIGVEQITYDNTLSPKNENILSLSWAFRSSNFSVNSKLNTITLNAGQGGVYKDKTQFNDNDFDGWRLYVETGEYYKILTSTMVSGSIQLNMEFFDARKFFSDTNSTIAISQQLVITPDVEEIEIVCTPNPSSTDLIDIKRFVFPINESVGKVKLPVYDSISSLYNIKYRYKHIKEYGPLLTLPDDLIGLYAESQFDKWGNIIITPTRTPYISNSTAGFIPLTIHPDAYSLFETRIDLGDLRGVDEKQLSNATQVIQLHVGTDKEYQFFAQSSFSLSQDLYINLSKTLIDNTTAIRDGNHFTLNFARSINCNGFKVYIVEDFTSISSYNTIIALEQKHFDFVDVVQLPYNSNGLVLNCIYDQASNYWIGTTANEIAAANLTSDWSELDLVGAIFPQVDPVGGTLSSTNAGSYFRYKIIGKTMWFQFNLNVTFTGSTNSVQKIKVDLSSIFKTSASANGGFRSPAIDNGSSETGSFMAKIPSNSGVLSLTRALPVVNFTTPGTYELAVNGTVNIQ